MGQSLKNTIIGLTLVVILVATGDAFAQSQGFQDPAVDPDFSGAGVYEYKELPPIPAKVKKEKKVPFKGYTRQKEYFYNICMQLFEDGRAEYVAKIAEQHKGGVVGCLACKAFFRLFFSQCNKVPKHYQLLERKISAEERRIKTLGPRESEKEEGEDEESDEEVPEGEEPKKRETLEEMKARLPKKQMDPRASVLDAFVRLSQVLFEDTVRMREHYKAVLLLEEGLLEPKGKTEAEKNYFGVVNEYLKAPFSRFEQAKIKVDEIAEREEEQRRREFMLDSNQLFIDQEDIVPEEN